MQLGLAHHAPHTWHAPRVQSLRIPPQHFLQVRSGFLLIVPTGRIVTAHRPPPTSVSQIVEVDRASTAGYRDVPAYSEVL
jgi:hypothetical protein